ncbi:MAG: hypothetical protein ACE5FV_11895 [Woeseia sp.]
MTSPCTTTLRSVALAAALFGWSLSPGSPPRDASDADETTKIEVRIERRGVAGVGVIRLTQGQNVEMVWTTDEAAELHIHGYDIRFEVSPGAPAEVSFTAHATGRFAVTSHGFGGEHGHGHETLIYIEVYPK